MKCRPNYSPNAQWPNIRNTWRTIHGQSCAVIGIDRGIRYCMHIVSNYPEIWTSNPIYGFRIKKAKYEEIVLSSPNTLF